MPRVIRTGPGPVPASTQTVVVMEEGEKLVGIVFLRDETELALQTLAGFRIGRVIEELKTMEASDAQEVV